MIRDKNPALFYGFAPDYVAATDWIQMELEIAQFHLANITSGMTPSMHVGFSNGVPTEEERRTIERQLNQKFAGTGNAGKILITFNDGKETTPTIEPIQMNDAQNAWVEMSKQSVNQILAGHRVTSPILFGIRAEGGGLGNNADELRDAFSLFSNTVIVPFQSTLIRGLEKIFRVNDINLDLYFKSLKPADFIDLEVTKTQSEEDQEKEGVSKEDIDTEDLVEMSDDEMNNMLEDLQGEEIDEELWEIVDEQDSDNIEDYDDWAKQLIKENKKDKFADEIKAKPDGFSYLDKSFYKIRFKYFKKSKRTRTPNGKKPIGKSRTFCKNMMRLAEQGTVYRIEDIDKASREGVNKQFGHKGKSYNLFKYKGGIWCTHAFAAVLYRLKSNTELIEGQPLEDYKKVSSIPKTYKPTPRGIKESREAANRGNNWWKYPGAKN